MHVVVVDSSGSRATVDEDAAEIHTLRGFHVIGPAVAPGDPRTVEEAAKEAAQREKKKASYKQAADQTSTSKKES